MHRSNLANPIIIKLKLRKEEYTKYDCKEFNKNP